MGTAQNPSRVESGENLRDPQPEDATRAILAAFDTFQIVAIGDYHGSQDLESFILSLIRNPAFPNTVNDIVVEGVNGLLQPMLDRYISGEDVPIAEARRLWRDGTNPVSMNDFQSQFFPLVRRINQRLPAERRLRVVGGEGGIDWANVTPAINAQYVGHREEHIAAVVEAEVLAKNHKALIFYGGAHLWHGLRGDAPGYENAMGYLERKHPDLAFVVFPYVGARQRVQCGLPVSANGISSEEKMKSWPVPSIARTKGTWLEDFGKSETGWSRNISFEPQLGVRLVDRTANPVDAYLYLGSPELLLVRDPSFYGFGDKDYIAELHRRQAAAGSARIAPRSDPDLVRQQEGEVFLCGAGSSR
jgi:hypothetical protein